MEMNPIEEAIIKEWKCAGGMYKLAAELAEKELEKEEEKKHHV